MEAYIAPIDVPLEVCRPAACDSSFDAMAKAAIGSRYTLIGEPYWRRIGVCPQNAVIFKWGTT